jgi:DNA-binding NtrC family response regulator
MKILVIDDEASQRDIVSDILRDDGYEVVSTGSGAEGLEYLMNGDCLLVLTDLKMPHMDGIEVLQKIRSFDPDVQVILMTAFGSIPSAVNAIKNGAYDYLTKPFNKEDLLRVVNRAADKVRLLEENRYLKDQVIDRFGYENLIGVSKQMREVFRLIQKIKDVDATVLISGESGTGKELVARAIHYGGKRRDHPFVALNCAAIPETLIESELFGYEKGAFTGASRSFSGKFEQAGKGTIFLDEIGLMPLHLQTRLLRVLQEKKITRIGGKEVVDVDVRVVAATNENLNEKIKQGQFRLDLFHRLNIFNIHIPPLRDRKEDISPLASHFLQKYSARYHRMDLDLTDDALKRLESYDYPGNVRELENIIEKTVLMVEKKEITAEQLMVPNLNSDQKIDHRERRSLGQMEKNMIVEALEKYGGSIKKAAENLGITYKTLQYRIKKYGLNKTDFK